jgi:hypothetical protein
MQKRPVFLWKKEFDHWLDKTLDTRSIPEGGLPDQVPGKMQIAP